jgi:hypothetical protein
MAYLVATAGRIRLPEHLEHQALTVLEVQLTPHEGRFHPDDPVEDLAALARYVGADLARDGDWLVVSTDRAGEPVWSEQSAAFYTGLGRFVTDGEVQLRGQDGAQWAYRYSSDGVTEVGARGDTSTAEAAAPPPPAPVEEPPPPPSPAPPSPAESAPAPGWPPPVDRPGGAAPDPFWADDAPAPRSPGRTVAMAVLLLGGIFLIVAIAMLAAGIA